MKSDLHCDGGFLRFTSAPQDQGEQREKHKESHNKSEKIEATRDTAVKVFSVKKSLFFNGVKLLPRLARLAVIVLAVVLGFE